MLPHSKSVDGRPEDFDLNLRAEALADVLWIETTLEQMPVVISQTWSLALFGQFRHLSSASVHLHCSLSVAHENLSQYNFLSHIYVIV